MSYRYRYRDRLFTVLPSKPINELFVPRREYLIRNRRSALLLLARMHSFHFILAPRAHLRSARAPLPKFWDPVASMADTA
eukprot:6201507-Pleurochrysis_carterae.AAC.1